MAICGVLKDGVWVDNPSIVKEEFRVHYQSLFSKQIGPRPLPDPLHFSTLSDVQIHFLQAPFTREEIKKAVWDWGSSKAPGPDGFSFAFMKRYWDIFGG